MTSAEIMTAIQTLPADLEARLLALPSGSTVSDFDAGEQADLTTAFGADWATILGIAA